MSIQAYNANIMQVLGGGKAAAKPIPGVYYGVDDEKAPGKPLYGIYYGVELEYEIDPRSKLVQKFVDATPPAKRSTLFVGEEQRQNTPVAHFVCDTVYPLVKDFCIIKRDGSLGNGIEVVSLPMSMDAHRTRWDDFFGKLPAHGLVVRATCGMHVHVSRELLTTLQIGKMLHFIHNPLNEPFLKIIAGRKPPEKYANITKEKKVTDVKTHSNANPQLRNRYDGFNITGGATIEFRFFKGTNSLERMLTNLDFCACLVAFTWPGAVGLDKNNLAGFLEFVGSNRSRKDFPYLYNFLVAKGFVIPTVKSCKNPPVKKKNVKPIKD
jgi:hypothetical protein